MPTSPDGARQTSNQEHAPRKQHGTVHGKNLTSRPLHAGALTRLCFYALAFSTLLSSQGTDARRRSAGLHRASLEGFVCFKLTRSIPARQIVFPVLSGFDGLGFLPDTFTLPQSQQFRESRTVRDLGKVCGVSWWEPYTSLHPSTNSGEPGVLACNGRGTTKCWGRLGRAIRVEHGSAGSTARGT
jgi:hypothetical protein